MSVALVVTGGYGNGTLAGSVAAVVLRGYLPSAAPADAVILRAVSIKGRQSAPSATGVQAGTLATTGREAAPAATGKQAAASTTGKQAAATVTGKT